MFLISDDLAGSTSIREGKECCAECLDVFRFLLALTAFRIIHAMITKIAIPSRASITDHLLPLSNDMRIFTDDQDISRLKFQSCNCLAAVAGGVCTACEQADAHLKLLALRQSREEYVSSLLQITPEELTLGGRKAIARWYEVYGYDDAMVQEAAVQAGPKRDLWYWNSILKTWNAKGLRTIHDVRGPVADAGASRNIRVDREAPSGNDFLGSSSLSASLNRLKKRSNT